jgi:hypothetical protein
MFEVRLSRSAKYAGELRPRIRRTHVYCPSSEILRQEAS